MKRKAPLAVLVAVLAAGLSACSVMQSTYQRKAEEADTLANQVGALQKRCDALSAENAALKRRSEQLAADLSEMTLQRDKLATDVAYVTGQQDKLAEDREEMEKDFKERSDAMSQTISDLRKRVSDLETENRRIEMNRVPRE